MSTSQSVDAGGSHARPQDNGLERLLLTPEEAAEVLGITRSTVYELMRMRLLRSVKIGKKYRRIPTAACRELVDRLSADDVA